MTDESALDAILALVRVRTGFDFAAYRRPTVMRRVRNRMLTAGIDTFPGYVAFIAASPDETVALLDRLTIKVSRFYRNAAAFDLVRGSVLPDLAVAAAGRPLRIWSAGCGRGEEPHTIAMLLEERGIPGRVFATDIDARALEAGAAAIYPEASLNELPAELRSRFLVPVSTRPGHWLVADAVRARVEWRIDDLAADSAPCDAFDMVCCRNVLIYLDRAAQERAMLRLVESLPSSSYLLLGEAEWPSPAVVPMLAPVAQRHRLFRAQRAHRLAA